jgi:hypothetical protein
MKRWILSSTAGIAISALAAHAHHSIAGAYDTNQQVTVEGIVTQFQFVNPHPFLTVEVKSDSGSSQQWRLEMDNRSELAHIGMTSQTLKQGDRIVVTGSPARAQSQSLYIRRLDRPADGFRYEQIGSSPRIRTPR